MNITVYLGAYEGAFPELRDRVEELGAWIGRSGHTLVYGGSKTGLMGRLAISALGTGAKVIGVEPRMFIESEFQLEELDELIVTEDMVTRKQKMIELGDAFIAMPGGTGTLEEISEIMSGVSLGLINAPCILFNMSGYYDGLKTLLRQMIDAGLSTEERQKGIYLADSLEEVFRIIDAWKVN